MKDINMNELKKASVPIGIGVLIGLALCFFLSGMKLSSNFKLGDSHESK